MISSFGRDKKHFQQAKSTVKHILVALLDILANLISHSDISLQDKMVVYDNERRQIGWVSTSCNKFRKQITILIALFILTVTLLCGYPSHKFFLVTSIISGKIKVFVNQKVCLVSYQRIIVSTCPGSFRDALSAREKQLESQKLKPNNLYVPM